MGRVTANHLLGLSFYHKTMLNSCSYWATSFDTSKLRVIDGTSIIAAAHHKAQRGCGYYIHDRILILRIQMSWKPATFKHVSHEGYHVDPILSDRDH